MQTTMTLRYIHAHSLQRAVVALLLLLLLLLLCAPALSAQQAEASEPVAMVTSVAGTATRATATDAESALAVGDELPAGTVLRVTQGSAALVFLSGEYVAVEAGESLTLGATAAASTLATAGATRGLAGDDAVAVADKGMQPQKTKKRWQTKLTAMYGIRGDANTVAVSPRLVTADMQPVFVFFDPDSTRADAERSYRLVVKNNAGTTVHERTISARPMQMVEATLPAPLAGAAAEADFTWTIAPVDAPTMGSQARFLIADAQTLAEASARRARIESLRTAGTVDAASARMLHVLGCIDERERLFADAVPHLLALMREPGSRTFAVQQLGLTLDRFGNQTAALVARMAELTGTR